jgi:hypothetical protein
MRMEKHLKPRRRYLLPMILAAVSIISLGGTASLLVAAVLIH